MASLWFVALQYSISMLIAGIAKIVSPIWRSGEAMIGISSTSFYGSPRLHTILTQHKDISKLLCWMVIIIECTFWLVFIVNWKMGIILLLIGLALHASIALTMGLNDFFWAFTATYPIIWFCSRQLTGH